MVNLVFLGQRMQAYGEGPKSLVALEPRPLGEWLCLTRAMNLQDQEISSHFGIYPLEQSIALRGEICEKVQFVGQLTQ